MGKLATHAEIAKLATLLGVEPPRLDFLRALDETALRGLRQAATARLFEDSRGLAQRLGAAGALLPVRLLALMTKRVFGAKLAARVAGEMKPARAVEISAKLPVDFLADVARQLDPGRARAILLQLPADTVRDIAIELLRRGEHVTLARFVDDISPAALRASIAAIADAEALLRVAFFVETRHRLDDIIDLLPDDRLRAMIALAQSPDHELRDESVVLLAHVGEAQKRRMAQLAGTPRTG